MLLDLERYVTASYHPRIYVAGPYTLGDKEANVHRAIEIGEAVITLGGVPFIPHLSHYWDAIHAHSHDFWLQYCLVWLRDCDAVWRIPGESRGASIEEGYAKLCGIPIFYSEPDVADFIWEKKS